MSSILFAAFAVLQTLDVATTLYVLDRGGRELNPFLAFLMSRLGRRYGRQAGNVLALVGTKTVMLVGAYAMFLPHAWIADALATMPVFAAAFAWFQLGALVVGCAAYAYVVGRNFAVARAM